ncbi:hypothetical protein M513_11283 [Trichuris suis]|uniref:Uncharacterized protein n=1 Tax=Trichuris suis TaxID=68888 RepID=A0A085LSC3_9BILA|nr:hypothetical protein M513_11283 [Trichuris suis]
MFLCLLPTILQKAYCPLLVRPRALIIRPNHKKHGSTATTGPVCHTWKMTVDDRHMDSDRCCWIIFVRAFRHHWLSECEQQTWPVGRVAAVLDQRLVLSTDPPTSSIHR